MPIDNELKNTSGEDGKSIKEEVGTEVERFQCKFCDFFTIKAKYLQRHLREKHDIKVTFNTEKSEKVDPEKRLESIKEHIYMEGETYICKTCQYTTTIEKYAKRHVQRRHPVDDEITEEEQVCPHCPTYKTHRKKYLSRHIRQNHNENIVDKPCDRCEYKTKSYSRLKRHVREVHEGIKDKVCSQCGAAFKRKAKLVYHIEEKHEGIFRDRKRYEYKKPLHKPHVCHLCTGTPFASHVPSGLKIHINEVHLKIGECICPHCDYRAYRPYIMKRHIKFVHEGCLDYKCDQCGYVFDSGVKLKSHKKTVHDKIRDNICDHCGGGFSAKLILKKIILRLWPI